MAPRPHTVIRTGPAIQRSRRPSLRGGGTASRGATGEMSYLIQSLASAVAGTRLRWQKIPRAGPFSAAPRGAASIDLVGPDTRRPVGRGVS